MARYRQSDAIAARLRFLNPAARFFAIMNTTAALPLNAAGAIRGGIEDAFARAARGGAAHPLDILGGLPSRRTEIAHQDVRHFRG